MKRLSPLLEEGAANELAGWDSNPGIWVKLLAAEGVQTPLWISVDAILPLPLGSQLFSSAAEF